jgi:HPt (histidine-containing phosphotransfer) domain-containing protein
MTDDHFERQFAALRDRFRVRLVDYRELLVDAQNLYVSSRDNEVVRRVKRIAHELAGASGTFGFPDLGELAADLEAAADSVLQGRKERNAVAPPLRQLLRELELTL